MRPDLREGSLATNGRILRAMCEECGGWVKARTSYIPGAAFTIPAHCAAGRDPDECFAERLANEMDSPMRAEP